MKKVVFFAAVVIAAVAGVTCYNYESDNELSDLAKKNVKALASDVLESVCFDTFEEAPFGFSPAVFLTRCSDCKSYWAVSVSERGKCKGKKPNENEEM